MFCTQCGKEVKPGASFCTNCGARVRAPQITRETPDQRMPGGGKTMAGKRVTIRYTGAGVDILGRYILWAILIIITIGIYGPWALNNFFRYVIEHTEVEIPD